MNGKGDDSNKKINIEMIKEWMESAAQGHIGSELEINALQNLHNLRVHRGLIQCNFVVPKTASDRDGNWHRGAIATLIDVFGNSVIASCVGSSNISVDFNISYFSKAKIDEEVEIEAKILGHKGKLSSNMVEIRKKQNGELVAVGKQWMASIPLHKSHPKL